MCIYVYTHTYTCTYTYTSIHMCVCMKPQFQVFGLQATKDSDA